MLEQKMKEKKMASRNSTASMLKKVLHNSTSAREEKDPKVAMVSFKKLKADTMAALEEKDPKADTMAKLNISAREPKKTR